MKSRFVLSFLVALGLTGASMLPGSPSAHLIPVFDLSGVLTESGQSEAGLLALTPDTQRPVTHFDLVASLQRAGADATIPAVVVELDQALLSYAQLQEIAALLRELRQAGKEVWLYSDGLTFQTALLGSAASQFVLNPEGAVSLNGLYAENLYFKGLLDRVGVQVDVVHIGDFKSAGENFYRSAPSQASERQTAALLDSLYQTLVTEMARGRGVTRDSLHQFINRGVKSAREAQAAGLVDHLQARTDFVAALQEKYGEEAVFDREYVLNGEKPPEIKGFFDLMKLLFSSGKPSVPQEDYVAVVVFEGGIDLQSIAPARNEVLRLVDDARCQALVLRVNSPGGSALASEVLWEAVDEFSQSERPVVVSMGSVAASGGYYISSGAEVIFAEPTTITGSIGVVGMKFALGGVMEKIGITTHEVKRGAHADLYNLTRPFSPKERGLVRESMEEVYGTFKQRILDGRGERLAGDLETLAGGRVYSGRDARRVGLVDELGGLSDAIARAAGLAELEEPVVALFPKPRSAFETLFQPDGQGAGNDDFLSIQSAPAVGDLLPETLLSESSLALLPLETRHHLREALRQLRALQRDRIQLLAPPLPQF
ncbi:signal peptide peptidase SppA [Roseibacillus ishigakijimensis]|uniref:Signal peptide peptidase SppA n=1 Tax=Roseibacillus ishigakijimensis TaxID=454146 RepID=A0A934RNU2_9BACT|nr:signal peptide peptidase SppA [Roseibacillus ishigakijimensis]MBK1835207.1 signal peptide peptidase SppA [Roseibacillus ishigakijimensis]